jgi:hypothetical protein
MLNLTTRCSLAASIQIFKRISIGSFGKQVKVGWSGNGVFVEGFARVEVSVKATAVEAFVVAIIPLLCVCFGVSMGPAKHLDVLLISPFKEDMNEHEVLVMTRPRLLDFGMAGKEDEIWGLYVPLYGDLVALFFLVGLSEMIAGHKERQQ